MARKRHDISNRALLPIAVGDIFGNLQVLALRDKLLSDGHYAHKCKCLLCGNICYVRSPDLYRGHNKSCGCLRPTEHGMTSTRFYSIWQNMKSRCMIPSNTCYDIYGGRGIKVCDRWLDFENFKEDMYDSYLDHVEKFGEKDTSIDRIDVNGDYEPSNCRWATISEQAYNKRITRYLTDKNGTTHTLKEWATILNIKYDTLKARLYRFKWPDDKILSTPVAKGGN